MPNEFSFNTGLGNSFIFGDMWDTIIQGTFVSAAWANQIYSLYHAQLVPGVQGDGLTYKIWSIKGTKEFHWLGTKGPRGGIIKFYIDDAYIAEIDTYAATGTFNQRATFPVTVTHTGEHTIKAISDTNNPESIGFIISITYLRIK